MTNYPEEAPKLSLLPFIIGDSALILAAILIARNSPTPISPTAMLAIAVCVALGAALLVIPYLINYARKQDALLTERQHQIAALARTTAESAEQISIAVAGLQTLATTPKPAAEPSDKLPPAFQAQIDQLTQQLSTTSLAAHTAIKDDLALIETAVEKIARTLTKLEAATKTKVDNLAVVEKDYAEAITRSIGQLETVIKTADTTVAGLAQVAQRLDAPQPPPAPIPSPVPEATAPTPPPVEPAPVIAEPVSETPPPAPIAEIEPAAIAAPIFTPAEPEMSDVPVDAPPPAKPPRARKAARADDGFELGLTPDQSESTEVSISSDGFTRLIATAYIGIGNKLYIRGDGPGLSWEKGTPLHFVSIGKWRWETPDATAPISVKLYKNDQVECTGLGTLSLEPGRQHEVNAGF